MGSEQRPAKIRKTSHAPGVHDAEMAAAQPSTSLSGHEHATTAQPAEDCILTESSISQDQIAQFTVNVEPKLSKNQIKKQRKLEEWEAGREDRKIKRKEKIKEKKARRRQEWADHHADGEALRTGTSKPKAGTQLPITVIFDCDFENYMFDHELKSLGLQLTRCYSDNRRAPYRFHFGVSSFGGKLKERFDGILAKQYLNWKGVHFCEEDFVEVSKMAQQWMSGPQGGKLAGALLQEGKMDEEASEEREEGEVVYLSSESDVTLERLKPNSTYIIGGLVDKNRHKGLCYKRAVARGIKTAKLPISEFMQLKSRQVLVTNHVQDIMLKWAELDDWGKAFMEVMPKRKGGVLKDGDDLAGDGEEGAEAIAGSSEA
ncbi:unnamed protein product [Periconia digitata]|uniref:tRNA (guanine(9)-N1)-methyltransferase n=1 Tax=Periconia digitata TaxID=1303443 RepID=A0A9W4UQF0_9PLEO|nr:unnamed protein product [Periconia digitata]